VWLAAKNLRTVGLARLEALATIEALDDSSRYDLVVVDEAQDLTTTALGVAVGLARGAGPGRDVTLIGDGGQSIYRAGFKWSDVGLRLGGGNVMTLSTCERSTAEIMAFASSLAGRHGEDHDEDRSREASRHGVCPRIVRDFLDREDQRAWLVDDIAQRLTTVAPRRIAVIARTRNELEKVRSAQCRSRLVRGLRRRRFSSARSRSLRYRPLGKRPRIRRGLRHRCRRWFISARIS